MEWKYNSRGTQVDKTCDILIIGGAVMGSSAAYWLSRMAPELSIIVIEPDLGYQHSSTALSVASIRQQFSTEVNVKISRFGIEFIKNIDRYIGQGSFSCGLGFQENGYLFLSGSEASQAAMFDACVMQNDLGAQTCLLTPDELAAKFPWLNCDDIHLASYGAVDEGWFDNMGLLNGLKSTAIAQGVRYVHENVTGLSADKQQITKVTLASGDQITAGQIINAAGTSASAILELLGSKLPVEPRKRTVFMIDAPNIIQPDAPLLVCHSGFYLRPERDKWICAIVPEDDARCAADDFEPDLHLFEDHLWPKLYHRAADFDAVKVMSAWAGHYAYNTLDQNAIIGRHPVWRNLFLMNGFSGHGLQQAPAVGRGIAELLLNGAYQSIDLSDLSVDRILEGRAFLENTIV